MLRRQTAPGESMITAYRLEDGKILTAEGISAPGGAAPFWIDVAKPTDAERALIEQATGLALPTREVMVEIEASSRLYHEDDTLFMTATLPNISAKPTPETATVTFVINAGQLLTVRHDEPKSIDLFRQRLSRDVSLAAAPANALMGLLDVIVDRIADLVEIAAGDVDAMSSTIFGAGISARRSGDYKDAINRIGSTGIRLGKVHDSIAALTRLIYFLTQGAETACLSRAQRSHLKTLARDLQSIKEHGTALDNKLNFLLDATVGLVNLEQNQIIKIFSVVAVIFMPPTLIASVYGMNFSDMPELSWHLGYEFSIGLMLVSAVVTLGFFRLKKLL
jgi:magnesium transporter